MWMVPVVFVLCAAGVGFGVWSFLLRDSADLKLWDLVALALLELVFLWFILTDLHPWDSWPFND